MKKVLYISSFTILGLILATILHAIIEFVALAVIFEDPAQFAETFWWKEWELVHQFGANFLWLLGALGGIYSGFVLWMPYGSKPGFYHWKKKV